MYRQGYRLDTDCGNLNKRISIITDYIKVCIAMTMPVKTFKKYPNSKPWIIHHNQSQFKGETQKAFQWQDWASLKIISQVRNDIIKDKLKYKEKPEQEFCTTSLDVA